MSPPRTFFAFENERGIETLVAYEHVMFVEGHLHNTERRYTVYLTNGHAITWSEDTYRCFRAASIKNDRNKINPTHNPDWEAQHGTKSNSSENH